MKASDYILSLQSLSVTEINAHIKSLSGIEDFFDSSDTIDDYCFERHENVSKEEYGDWQTNQALALSVCRKIKLQGFCPDIIIEPTCGKGNFILAAIDVFDSVRKIYGIEIYKPYINDLKETLLQRALNGKKNPECISIENKNVFDYDFNALAKIHAGQRILVLGNPPWVTNSRLSSINSWNLPEKSNFKQNKGLDAITGKGNFDIAEYISRMLLQAFSNSKGKFAFLVKNVVPKNILLEQKKSKIKISNVVQLNIDASKEFGVSASASLLMCDFGGDYAMKCSVFDFYTDAFLLDYGWVNNNFVSNTEFYKSSQQFDGVCPFEWWSGVKHDCSKVMELRKDNCGQYINALGEIVDIEDDLIYPLLKSSDIGDETIREASHYVIITQHYASENTDYIKLKYPKAYRYLISHAQILDERKSVIYKKRPRFSIFGIGSYSFAPYKIAVSGLYKHARFSLILPIEGKPVILDDTCYLIGFESESTARITLEILNNQYSQMLVKSLMFSDAKRVINKELLMRIDIKALAVKCLSKQNNVSAQELDNYMNLLSSGSLF